MDPELEAQLELFKEQLIAVIVDMGSSLHRQIQESEARLEAKMDIGFERVEARMGRHAA